MPSNVQDLTYGDDHDYVAGSPHLTHAQLRRRIYSILDATMGSWRSGRGRREVLEIGAGHGDFTERLRSTGVRVTTVEMSRASAAHLGRRYAEDPSVTVIHDADGTWPFTTTQRFDAVVCVSVLHHIPQYLAAVRRLADITKPGGAFVSWQDPLWYPRLDTRERVTARIVATG
jgi:2-polyprenyl-3-methyl-5-hydroxy-6-metoxy-1,4-benzoquinol methylase